MKLDASLARAAIEKLGDELGSDPEETARAVIEVANENIAEAMRLLTVRRGLDPRHFDVAAFGGAGPLHGAAVARSIGARRVIVPPHPGLASAFGTLLADPRVDKAWTHIVRSDAIDLARVNARLDELVGEALEELRRRGSRGSRRSSAGSAPAMTVRITKRKSLSRRVRWMRNRSPGCWRISTSTTRVSTATGSNRKWWNWCSSR